MTRRSDPGLQLERTALAWHRTALAMAANALLVLRAGVQSGAGAILIAGVALGIVAIALVVIGEVRRRHLTMPAPIAPAARLIGLTSISVALAAACGFWSIAQ